MGKIYSFEDLETWKESRKLLGFVMNVVGRRELSIEYFLVSQIKSSTISVMANIAEGFGRYGLKDSKNFYIIARGSLNETKSHLYVLKDMGYMKESEFVTLYNQTNSVGKLLNGLILL